MAHQYQPRRFFRNAPNSLLQQYFSNRNVLKEVDFTALKETQIEPIYEGWLALSEDARNEMERDFQSIDELASEAGTRSILDEARFWGEDLAAQFATLDGFHEHSFWTFLERPNFLLGALAFHRADMVPESFWRKRKNIPRNLARVDEAAIHQFEQRIGDYFHTMQARGKNCKVECYKRNDLDYFFAYPADYAQAAIEWEGMSMARRSRHPAFEIIFVYSQKEGTLDIYLPGDRKPVPDLQGLFAEVILQAELGADEKDQRVYDLKPFLSETVNFVYSPESGIVEVTVRKIRLKVLGTSERITLEADPSKDKEAVFDLLDRLALEIPVTKAVINQVGITVTFAGNPASARVNTRSFDITWPNSLRLKYDPHDLIIRKMLVDTGIEPKEPVKEGDATP